MNTLQSQFGRDATYWGDRGEWLVVLAQHRDSEIVDQSNFDVAKKRLEEVNAECIEIEQASHWAVGWVEYLIVDPQCKDVVEKAEEITRELEDYPVLDESDYSQREWDEHERHKGDGKYDDCFLCVEE